jgi:hypothetical protein
MKLPSCIEKSVEEQIYSFCTFTLTRFDGCKMAILLDPEMTLTFGFSLSSSVHYSPLD